MSYVSKKEKVFDLPDLDENSSSSCLIKCSDHELEIFPSVSDEGPIALKDQKYQQICAVANNKTGKMKSNGFKYIPFDVLLTILMAEKDAYIQKLLMKQKHCICGEQLFKAEQFQEAENDKEALIRKDAEVIALKNRNAGLETELEECRDNLEKALLKLKNVEEIANEKEFFKKKLAYVEEMVKLLEESKKNLEYELHMAKGDSKDTEERERGSSAVDENALSGFWMERDALRQQIKNLQEQLTEFRINAEDIELLKEQTETFVTRLETLLEENEWYKKKLEGMKHLEKCLNELRKQACILGEKYKRESHKAIEQMNQLNTKTKELQAVLEERDLLRDRVKELVSIESEYYLVKKKLSEVEELMDENGILGAKLNLLHKLESENEKLKCEMENLKLAEEEEVNVTKEMMEQLRCDLSDQEKEIKSLLSKIEHFSENYIDKKELNNLESQLKKNENILKEYESRLNEIPILESQLEDLRGTLQKYMDDFMSDEKLIRQLQDELQAYRQKFRDPKEISVQNAATLITTTYEEKVTFTEELVTVHEFVNESCPTIKMDSGNSKFGEKTDESKNLISENTNNGRIVIENSHIPVRMNLVDKNLNQILIPANKLKALLDLKEERIRKKESEVTDLKNDSSNCLKCQNLIKYSFQLEGETLSLQEANQHLQSQLVAQYDAAIRVEGLEESLRNQSKSCEFFKRFLKDVEGKLASEIINRQNAVTLSTLIKEEAFLSKKALYKDHLTEMEDLKSQILFLKIFIEELKEENHILNKLKILTEFTKKKNLTNVLTKLSSELLILQNFCKPELKAEYEDLQAEVKHLVIEVDHLVQEMEDLKAELDMERKSRDQLEKELCQIQKKFFYCTKTRSENKTHNVATMATECPDQTEEIRNALNDIKLLKDENDEFVKEIAILQGQCRDFQDEVTVLHNNMNDLSRSYAAEKDTVVKQKEEINVLNEKIKAYEQEMTILRTANNEFSQKSIELREKLTAKEAEVERTKKELNDMKNEIVKLNTEIGWLKHKMESQFEKNDANKFGVEKNNSEKEGSESMILKVENDLEELRRKLEACGTSEEKLAVLRNRRDNLIVKVNCFESEVQFLKRKLSECNFLKNELEKLKAEKKLNGLDMTIEGEEKLLTDIFGLREHLQLQQREIEYARCENSNLKDKLHELGDLLEICKKMHKTIPQNPPKTDIGVATSNRYDRTGNDNAKLFIDRSTSCENVGDTLNIEEFEMKLIKIESKHKMKILKLKEGNTIKIKRLIEQYKKESENSNRTYNENLNNIKSNYEYDIRKLVERHKSSILKLQYLHEDEIKELNTNYEIQMEAMQTLNENAVNDLTSGAVEKSKLAEKYIKDIEEIESKFQKLLKEKENKHMAEVANLQESLTRNMNELKELHKQDIENLSHMYNKNLIQLQEKHRKELKKYKRSNIRRNDIVRLKYEDLLIKERKKCEKQMQIMSKWLKLGEKNHEINGNVKFSSSKQSPISNEIIPKFNKILEKVLNEGLESIKFDELMLVHCKTCFAVETFYEKIDGKADNEKGITRGGCPHMPLLREDREELLKRIFRLENEIAIKRLETREAIMNKETVEKCRMEEIDSLLQREREKNRELERLLTAQTKVQTDLKIESYMLDKKASLRESNFIEVVKELEIEKSEKQRLAEEVQKEKNNIKRLNLMLENERQRFKAQRKKDSEYIRAMRMRLEEALGHEYMMESRLDYEAQIRTKLESEFESLQRSFNLIMDQPSSAFSSESKVVKDIRNLDQIESEKGEKLTVAKSRNKVKSQKNI